MHHEFNAFLLLFLIFATSLYAVSPPKVNAASQQVTFGIRVWNYNTTRAIPYALISVFNNTSIRASGISNQTGWANFTGIPFGLGNYTLQVKFSTLNLIIYNNTLNVNQTTIYRSIPTTVADHSFIFVDNLSRHVQQVTADLRINSTVISSGTSAANGTAVVRNLPFHAYNVTLSREGVFLANRTFTQNVTAASLNTVVTVPTYNYDFTAQDYRGANTLLSGTVSVYDWEVSTNNATKPLGTPAIFPSLWPGIYFVTVTSSNATVWHSSFSLSGNTNQTKNANIGYTITLHIFDVFSRPISSVSVTLFQNGGVGPTVKTDSSGIALFTNLPESTFQLSFKMLQRSYTTFANITGASVDISVKLDDIILIGNAPFNTAPIEASSALILTVIAILGTVMLHLRRKNLSNAVKSKEISK